MSLQRLDAHPPPIPRQTGILTIGPTGTVTQAPDFVIVDPAFLLAWARPDALKTRRGAVKSICHGRHCRRTDKPCLGHYDEQGVIDAQLGDLFVIGNPSKDGKVLYQVTGRHEWTNFRLERRA
jgi:hypothetical protein